MSNPDAIAAVTATLQSILFQGLKDGFSGIESQCARSTRRGRTTRRTTSINLFLYQVVRNATWRNADMPRQVRPGETGNPPLPLNLYYLVTAYGEANDATKPSGHELLGRGDEHSPRPSDARRATRSAPPPWRPLPATDLDRQIERVRITCQPISLDEMSKLWTGFA